MRHVTRTLDPAAATLEGLAPRIIRVSLGLALAGIVASALLTAAGGGLDQFLHSYLVAFVFFLSLTLGALYFVVLQHLVRAGCSVVVRRPAEALAMNMPLLALLSLPVLFGLSRLYPWASPANAADAWLLHKRPFLNVPFFLLRWVVYFGVWTWMARYFWTRSVRQDGSGEVALTRQMEHASGGSMALFALTLNFCAFDLLMSLAPRWYSTIFGVYFYAGSTVGFFALLSVLIALLQRSGRLGGAVSDEHYHDLGKLVFAYTIFWAYIAFSQFMLIWYANIPEETAWYRIRVTGPWQPVGLLLLFGHFFLPFFYLLPRFVKRRPKLFGPMAAWVLLMHYTDLYWVIRPEASPGRVPLHPMDVACVLAVGGLWLAAAAHRLRRRSLVPSRDPRLLESLAFENA